ncbi:MAG: hypothetical protein QOD40_3279 [Alphaproteobacteria bacterium]|jgi:hypothetical protein|nr:hypothetical protein [Alphaproteobacteria bacterium]
MQYQSGGIGSQGRLAPFPAHSMRVMAGLVPAIHVFAASSKTWMPATSAGMTV